MNREGKIDLEYHAGEPCFYLHAPFSRKPEVQKVGGVWNQSNKAWKFAVDPNIWEAVKAQFGGRSSLWATKGFLREIERIRKCQQKFFALKKLAEEDNPVEYSVKGIALNGKNPLFNYQKWGVKCGLQAGDGFLIGDQPGLGKSVQALGIAIQRKQEGFIRNCLIVCLAPLKYNWMTEIEKFTHERAIVIDGSAEERKKRWAAEGYFFKIVNYEIIVQDLYIDNSSRAGNRKMPSREEAAFRKEMQKQFEMIIVDEIHAIKHHKSQRAQAIKQMKAKFRLGLSGTPVDGCLEELHSIFEFLKPGLFESRRHFLERHAILDPFGSVKAYVNLQEVRNKIIPYYLRRLKEKVLPDLPEKLYKDIYIDLDKPEYNLYQEIVRGAHEITEESQAAIRVLRARQFLDFPELLGMRNKSQKFLALRELLEELIDANNEKILIFTQYRQVLNLILFNLQNKYPVLQIHGGVDAKDRVERVKVFNTDRKYSVLIGTDAMSTGLNIGGANAVIHFDDHYSPSLMQQRNDRAHRATTRHNVTIYRFICKKTIEENIRKALESKMDLNNRILEENCSDFKVSNLTNLDLLKYL